MAQAAGGDQGVERAPRPGSSLGVGEQAAGDVEGQHHALEVLGELARSASGRKWPSVMPLVKIVASVSTQSR
jgi:hypothetical protein